MTMMMRRDDEKGGEGLIIAKLFLVTFTFEIIPTEMNVAVPNVVWIKVEREIIRIVLKNYRGLHRP